MNFVGRHFIRPLQCPNCSSCGPSDCARYSALPGRLRVFYGYESKAEFRNDPAAFVDSAFWAIHIFN